MINCGQHVGLYVYLVAARRLDSASFPSETAAGLAKTGPGWSRARATRSRLMAVFGYYDRK